MNVRTVITGMLPTPRKTPEEIRARNRKNVKAWRARNREKWNAMQTRSRDRRRDAPKRVYPPRVKHRETNNRQISIENVQKPVAESETVMCPEKHDMKQLGRVG
jgi:hypothetical protein